MVLDDYGIVPSNKAEESLLKSVQRDALRDKNLVLKVLESMKNDTGSNNVGKCYEGCPEVSDAFIDRLIKALQEEPINIEAMSEAEFLDYLFDNFGINNENGKILYKTFGSIQTKFPELSQKERDYLFNRIVGGFVYEGFDWNSTAGGLDKYFSSKDHKKIFSELGVNGDDYDKLRYQIRVQNQITSGQLKVFDDLEEGIKEKFLVAYNQGNKVNLTLDQFSKVWDSQVVYMIDKGDYAHQSITTATYLYDMPNVTLAKIYVAGGENKVKEMSGWLGDATFQTKKNEGWFNGKSTQFGPDDYIADLDAANITYLMNKNNESFLSSSNKYYNQLLTKENNRAKIFMEHTPYSYVEEKVFRELPVYPPQDMYGRNTLQGIQKYQPDTYKFLMNLKNGNHTMQDY